MLRISQVVVCLAALTACTLGKNQQEWSLYTYNDESFSLKCTSDKIPVLTATDTVVWRKHGVSGELMTDDHYELRSFQGAANAELYVKKVTDDVHGIYICHIRDASDNVLDSVVRGLNWGTRLYHDDIDKYQENVVIGAIAAGSTFFLIVAVCLINQFRYLSEESLEKRQQRKERRLRHENNGVKNQAFSGEMTETNHQTNGSGGQESSYVHF